MKRGYYFFIKNIYSYCDKNIGDEFLFPYITSLWDEQYKIKKRDLTKLTSKIISRLMHKNPSVLREIKSSASETVYPFYKVLPHKKLLWEENPLKRKLGKSGEKKKILEASLS